MNYFTLQYPESEENMSELMTLEKFRENVRSHDFIFIAGYESNSSEEFFDLNFHLENIQNVFNDEDAQIDQVIFHKPCIPEKELDYVEIGGVSVAKKHLFDVDLEDINRISDKIKQVIDPKYHIKVKPYKDLDFIRYAEGNTEYSRPDFQMMPSMIRTKSLIGYTDVFYSVFISRSEYDSRLLGLEMVKSKFNSCYLCATNPRTLTTWNPDLHTEPRDPENMTVVTGFLKLKKRRGPKSGSASYDYLVKSKDTLSLRQNMVIYLSAEIIPQVRDFRKKLGLLHKTKIVKIDENDLYMIDELEKVEANTLKNKSPYTMAKYIMAVNSRYGYLERAIDKNYFNTDYFSWMDFSGGHIIKFPKNPVIAYGRKDKVRICWICRYKTEKGFTYNHQVLGGGFFMAHKDTMKKYCRIHDKEFRKLVEKGHNINDDKMCFLIFERYPELFDIYYSAYATMLTKA